MRRALLMVVALGCRSEGPAVVPLDEAPAAYAAAYCERIFACCDAGEVGAQFPSADPPVTDIASCEMHVARIFGNEFIDDTRRAIAARTADYDPAAMWGCAAQLRAGECPQLARVFQLMVFPESCPTVRPPRVATGGDCDHDFQCESSLCVGGGATQAGRCEERPEAGKPCLDRQCVAGAYCDSATGSCAPLERDGTTCTSPFQCQSFACVGAMPDAGRCGSPTTCNGTL